MARLFVLDSTAKSITANTVLTSSSVDFICTYADNDGSTFAEKSNEGQITGTTDVTMVAAPASGTRRIIKTINLCNSGTVTQTIRIYIVNGSTKLFLTTVVLAAGNTWSLDDVGTYISTTGISTTAVYKNYLLNGNFTLSQRTKPGSTIEYTSTTPYTNFGGNYTHDRWFILSSLATGTVPNTSTTGIKVSQGLPSIAGTTNNADASCILTGTDTTVSKFGIAQPISGTGLANTSLTLSFQAKATSLAVVTNIKAAIVAFTGASTAFSRMFINAWGSFGTNPSYVANFTNLAVLESDSTLSDSNWKTYSLTTNVGSTAPTFLVAFIWCEGNSSPLTTLDSVYIQNVQLETGQAATTFEKISLADNQSRCYPYYYAQYGGTYGSGYWLTSALGTAQTFNVFMPVPVKMRAAPTLELFSQFGKIASTTKLGATVGTTVVSGAMTATVSGGTGSNGSGTTADTTAIIVRTAAGSGNDTTAAFNAFPSTGYLKIDSEIIRYSSKETSNVTVGGSTVAVNKFKGLTRGLENSTPANLFAAHSTDAIVASYGTALFGDFYALASASSRLRLSLLGATLVSTSVAAQGLNIAFSRNAVNSSTGVLTASGTDLLIGGTDSRSFIAANAEI